jgi:phospholipase C
VSSVLVAAAFGCNGAATSTAPPDLGAANAIDLATPPGSPDLAPPATSNIKHVVLIVQENHTFDAYFGGYCTAAAGSHPTCNQGPDCCEAAPSTEPSGAGPMTLDDTFNLASDPNHSQMCERQQIDGGAMDQFVTGSNIGSTLCTSACSRPENFAIAGIGAMATYWQYAGNYALADRYFQPIAGGSGSNSMYFAVARFQFLDNDAIPDSIASGCLDPTGVCLNGAKTTYDSRATIADLLLQNGNTFAVYADGYADAVAAGTSCPSAPNDCPYSAILHPISRRSCLYNPADIPFQYYRQLTDDPQYIKDYSLLITDIDNGALPDFSYVKARLYRSEHPNVSDIGRGVTFVKQTIDAIQSSPYASDTLILVTWDEGGGYFDHVSPPAPSAVDGQPYGTRVPLLAIGRFARTNWVSHVEMEHSSVVRFLEYNFLGATGQLQARDATVSNLGSLLDPAQTGIVIPDN